MNLNQVKQEAREDISVARQALSALRQELVIPSEHPDPGSIEDCFRIVEDGLCIQEETLDRLVDEIEKAVVPEARLYTQPKSELDDVEITEKEAFNRCRAQVKEAFTRFKGEPTELESLKASAEAVDEFLKVKGESV